MDKAPKELNAKAYAMTLKKEEALNQWCYKTSVWTDFSRIRVRTEIGQ